MNILITGGAGFIGRSLQERLVKSGNSVTLLDIKELSFELPECVTYIQSDVCDTEKMLTALDSNQFNGIIHLAAVSRVVVAENNPQECKRTNIGGVYSLLNGIEKMGQKPWMIFGSSREVYGEPNKLPVSEDAPKIAVNIYGETKIKGENLFLDFSNRYSLNCAIVRFSNVYGNRYDIFDRVIPRFIRSIISDSQLIIEGGEQLVDFTHIDDTVNGVLRIMEYLNGKDNTQDDFHICPGIGWSLHQLINFIEQATGKKAIKKINQKRNYDVVKFVGDNDKVKKHLGLNNFISLEEGIIRCIDEYCHDLKTGFVS